MLTFLVCLVVLVLQFLWKYIEDLAGKGLEIWIILELFFYASATLIPMALPLAILLSSIMVVGNFAENLELVGAKASGIGLIRFLLPLFIFSLFMSGFAFFASNNLVPVSQYKLKNLLEDIRKTKPAIDIVEGSYYEGIKGFSIRVEKKNDDQSSFEKMVIYDHTKPDYGAGNIIIADKGNIAVSDNGYFLFLNLFKGVRYSDINFYTKKEKGYPMQREFFKEQSIIIDLREFLFKRNQNNFIGNPYQLMTVGQLDTMLIEANLEKEKSDFNAYQNMMTNYSFHTPIKSKEITQEEQELLQQLGIQTPNQTQHPTNVVIDSTMVKREIKTISFGSNFLNTYNQKEKNVIKSIAVNNISALKMSVENQINNTKSKKINIARNRIEYHKKFTLSIACLLLFMIGAPLGAIIKKGGLGFPLIFSIIIFILYYIISTVGEKQVRSLTLSPIEGMWLSSFVLLPIGIFMIMKASSESKIFSIDSYKSFLRRPFGKK